jgi:hypothetical protein
VSFRFHSRQKPINHLHSSKLFFTFFLSELIHGWYVMDWLVAFISRQRTVFICSYYAWVATTILVSRLCHFDLANCIILLYLMLQMVSVRCNSLIKDDRKQCVVGEWDHMMGIFSCNYLASLHFETIHTSNHLNHSWLLCRSTEWL